MKIRLRAISHKLTVGPDGLVSEALVERSSGREDCDYATRDAILSEWRFKPAHKNGVPIQTVQHVRVNFEIE